MQNLPSVSATSMQHLKSPRLMDLISNVEVGWFEPDWRAPCHLSAPTLLLLNSRDKAGNVPKSPQPSTVSIRYDMSTDGHLKERGLDLRVVTSRDATAAAKATVKTYVD